MGRRAWILLLVLASLWGASYMFIKIGLEHGLSAPAIVFLRTALAALVLLPVALRTRAVAALRGRLGPIALLAFVQVAGPFMLIAFGERQISSSLTGILVSTAPIFTFLLAFGIEHADRAGASGLAGVAIGLAGVGLLLGIDAGGGLAALVGALMVVLASFGYALGAHYLKRALSDVQPVGVVTATMAASALMAAPVAAFELPSSSPSAGALTAVAALGVLGTGLAFVIFYRLIGDEGPSKASLVAYVAPAFAVLYGVTLLGEPFTVSIAAGLALIVGGSWLAAEARLPWRRSAPSGELTASRVDVATAGESDGGAYSALLERRAEGGDRLPGRAA